MPRVHLAFTALPEHVRTARLVATAVARRLTVDVEQLEEIRLAVGEACARAVRRSAALDRVGVVTVDLHDDGGRLVVEVTDDAGADAAADDLALTLLAGLAPAVAVEDGPGGPGGRLRLDWPAGTV
ncbi:ATP-binding protein [Kineosporiaceae bacterium SCSIO 59966]|nr:ATP-binding protein [Kineosporiaceae bacterium SCSIO 59966]